MYDVELVLDKLQLEHEIQGENARALCPMHERLTGKADNHPSWFIHLERGTHHCFSCGYKGSLTQLICDVKDYYLDLWGDRQPDIASAKRWLTTARRELQPEEAMQRLKNAQQRYAENQRWKDQLPTVEESHLAIFGFPSDEALDSRDLTKESALAYGVLWQKKGNYQSWILPLREPDTQKLMGWQVKGHGNRFFRNYPPGLKKSHTLFGVHAQRKDQVIVVESPLDCLRISSAGHAGAVATCGAIVSEAQIKLMSKSDKVIVAFDNPNIDEAGKKACDHLRVINRKYGMNLFFFNYGDSGKKDPGDMTNNEITWGIENAKPAILGEAAYVYRDAKALSN